MATKTITTYEHSCDLCGEVREKTELSRLYDEAPNALRIQANGIDICASCMTRPVAEVFERFRSKKAASTGRSPEDVVELQARLARLEAERPDAAE